MNGLRTALFESLNGKVFYGWVIVGVSGLIMFGTGPGQSHLIGLFFEPISKELQLSRTSVAIAYGMATFAAAFLLPKMGRLIDRFGPAGMIWGIAAAFGLSCILFSFAQSWIYLALGFACLRFLGQGSLMLNCANLVAQWFSKRRGFALGIMALGFPLSIALHPPLVQNLIDTVGWRETWIWLGVMTWIMLLPPALLLLFSRPEDVGLRPDGVANTGAATPQNVTGIDLQQALRSRNFYLIVAGLFSMSMLITSLHVENTGILVQHGLSPQTAANMFIVTGLTAVVAMPIIGRLLDGLPTRLMFVAGLITLSLTLLSATLVQGFASAIAYAVMFGVMNGITMTYFNFMWPRYFGRKHLGSVQGTGQMIGVIGASLGPLPVGFAVDHFGSYDGTLRLLAIFPILFAILAFGLRTPRLVDGNAVFDDPEGAEDGSRPSSVG